MDVCPITLVSFNELENPVAFIHNPSQLYECEALIRWLLRKKTDPKTNLPVSWEHDATEILLASAPRAMKMIIEQLSGAFLVAVSVCRE